MFPEVDPSSVETCITLLRAAADVASFHEQYFAQHSLSEGRFTVMILLFRALHIEDEPREKVSPAEIADMAGVSRATITGLVDRLEQDGFVKRQPSQVDRRMVEVSLTPEGKRVLESMFPGHFRRIAALFSHLNEDERSELMRLLRKLSEGLPGLAMPSAESAK